MIGLRREKKSVMSSLNVPRVLPMAIRNVTQEFVNLRDNYKKRKHVSGNYSDSPRETTSFSPLEETLNPETFPVLGSHASDMPPIWVETCNRIKTDLSMIREKDTELAKLHQSRLKVVFDDEQTKQLDKEIDQLTQTISSLFHKCTSNIKRIALLGNDGKLSESERSIRYNLMRALGSKVHDLSSSFRDRQKEFLIRMKEMSSGGLFGPDSQSESNALVANIDYGFTDQQLSVLENAEHNADMRGQQIARIAKSVHELAQMWHEMSILVAEQGTMLDRIDYNVEQSLVSIRAGVPEIEEAEEYQKSSRSCLIAVILIMVAVIIIAIMIYKGQNEKK